jgi:type I site-specific restriction endonuclease
MTFRRATGVRLQTGIPFAFVRIPQEYFDAVKIGLTATPALHTVSIFGDPIFKYSYREAVIDGDLIDHEPPVQITTALSKSGIRFAKRRRDRNDRSSHGQGRSGDDTRRNPFFA